MFCGVVVGRGLGRMGDIGLLLLFIILLLLVLVLILGLLLVLVIILVFILSEIELIEFVIGFALLLLLIFYTPLLVSSILTGWLTFILLSNELLVLLAPSTTITHFPSFNPYPGQHDKQAPVFWFAVWHNSSITVHYFFPTSQ